MQNQIYAAITGWGKCLPPAILTNHDISTVIDTSDEWITSRTGIHQRRISHVSTATLATNAAKNALDCAGINSAEVDLVLLATCTPTTMVANTASLVQQQLGATNAAACDVNAACSGFLYALQNATAQIKSGMIKTAVVIGAERMSWYINWAKRDSAVLFGDGAGAVVLQASEQPLGLLGSKTGCDSTNREILHISNFGTDINKYEPVGPSDISFQGPEIFKRAIKGMAEAVDNVLAQTQYSEAEVNVIVPHQANLRIIQALQSKLGVADEKVMVNIHKYGNTSAATIPIALCEAVENGLIQANDAIMSAAFGAGLTWAAGLIKWGERITPITPPSAFVPNTEQSALDILSPAIQACLAE